MYQPKSMHAEEFINHEEILETLAYAEQNKSNTALISYFAKSSAMQRTFSSRSLCFTGM